jgi:hypothetical protein
MWPWYMWGRVDDDSIGEDTYNALDRLFPNEPPEIRFEGTYNSSKSPSYTPPSVRRYRVPGSSF